jgi:hypothetical protein
MFIINTDMGYIAGKMHDGLRFTVKEDARQFTVDQIKAFGEGIALDLHKYYCAEWCLVEQV